jgi:hypothetical protein
MYAYMQEQRHTTKAERGCARVESSQLAVDEPLAGAHTRLRLVQKRLLRLLQHARPLQRHTPVARASQVESS